MAGDEKKWNWVWPVVGLNQISPEENFNMGTNVVSMCEPLVRESIQNSIDAGKRNNAKNVYISFVFGKNEDVVEGKAYSEELYGTLNKYRAVSGIEKINYGNSHYLKIQDHVNKGGMALEILRDFIQKFGEEDGSNNKNDSSLGGAGRGRHAIIDSSKIQTLLVRSNYDSGKTALITGTSLLKPAKYEGYERNVSAQLCTNSVDDLEFKFDFDKEFIGNFEYNFSIDKEYEGVENGVSLIIPQPHEDINEENIINNLIENFTPAILSGYLVVKVGNKLIDSKKLRGLYSGKKILMHQCIRLLEKSYASDTKNNSEEIINIPTGEKILPLKDLDKKKKEQIGLSIEESLNKNGSWFGKVKFTLSKNQNNKEVKKLVDFNINVTRIKDLENSHYNIFRSGMLIPEALTGGRRGSQPQHQNGMVIIVDVKDPLLSEYLKNCEHKAHRYFDVNKNVKNKLKKAGFKSNLNELKLLQSSARDIVELISSADNVSDNKELFADMWGLNIKKKRTNNKKEKVVDTNRQEVEYIPKVVPPCIFFNSEEYLQIEENPKKKNDYEEIIIGFAYTNQNSAKFNNYHPLDFQLDKDIKILCEGAKYEVTNLAGNCSLIITDLQPNWNIKLSGFDINRETFYKIKSYEEKSTDA